MKLIFLGTGSAFGADDKNYHSNMLLTNSNNQHLLLDCGSDARMSLHAQQLSYADIDAIFISHFHADHVGGLEWLGFSSKLDENCKKPTLFIKDNMFDRLWNNVLSGGMSSFEDKETSLKTFFEPTIIDDNNQFTWQTQKFETVQTVHVMDNQDLVPSYGLFFATNKQKIFISFDTQFVPNRYEKFYQAADIIFHDCETKSNPSGVHSHFTQLITLPESIRNKMWLYHYDPGELPDAKAHGFQGFVECGQVFEV